MLRGGNYCSWAGKALVLKQQSMSYWTRAQIHKEILEAGAD